MDMDMEADMDKAQGICGEFMVTTPAVRQRGCGAVFRDGDYGLKPLKVMSFV